MASYLTYALRHLETGSILIDGIGGMFSEQLRWSALTMSLLPSATRLTRAGAVELSSLAAKTRGAHHIAITDSRASPLAAFSEVCFVVREAQGRWFAPVVKSAPGANVSEF